MPLTMPLCCWDSKKTSINRFFWQLVRLAR